MGRLDEKRIRRLRLFRIALSRHPGFRLFYLPASNGTSRNADESDPEQPIHKTGAVYPALEICRRFEDSAQPFFDTVPPGNGHLQPAFRRELDLENRSWSSCCLERKRIPNLPVAAKSVFREHLFVQDPATKVLS